MLHIGADYLRADKTEVCHQDLYNDQKLRNYQLCHN